MNCPFCNSELIRDCYDDCGMLECHNPKCQHYYDSFIGREELWQELIRTRKALDKAKNGLKELKDIIACPPDISYETCVSMYADGVLQEITALEQKE